VEKEQYGEHAASICKGQVGVLHGNLTYLLQDLDGQILEGTLYQLA
jgi:tryptophan synthase beta chain